MNAMIPTLPVPRFPVEVRPATAGDLPFIDSLQKLHAKQVGWMPTKQLEGKVERGHVLVAEESDEATKARSDEGKTEGPSSSPPSLRRSVAPSLLGYCIGHDQYFKRDDLGIIYQMNVVPDRQRGLIGATLVKAMFDRAAYGCRLFCCWCAQDIEANYFWESLGFVPLAFRTGSRGKRRVHIFWQRRVRAGDTTTPYWFPSQTTSGSIREDRLVLPIPPGTHWREVMPVILPKEEPEALPEAPMEEKVKKTATPKPRIPTPRRGVRLGPPPADLAEPPVGAKVVVHQQSAGESATSKKKPKPRNDPRHVAAARELRDRWLERVNAAGGASVLESRGGKYDVSRQLDGAPSATKVESVPMLEAA